MIPVRRLMERDELYVIDIVFYSAKLKAYYKGPLTNLPSFGFQVPPVYTHISNSMSLKGDLILKRVNVV